MFGVMIEKFRDKAKKELKIVKAFWACFTFLLAARQFVTLRLVSRKETDVDKKLSDIGQKLCKKLKFLRLAPSTPTQAKEVLGDLADAFSKVSTDNFGMKRLQDIVNKAADKAATGADGFLEDARAAITHCHTAEADNQACKALLIYTVVQLCAVLEVLPVVEAVVVADESAGAKTQRREALALLKEFEANRAVARSMSVDAARAVMTVLAGQLKGTKLLDGGKEAAQFASFVMQQQKSVIADPEPMAQDPALKVFVDHGTEALPAAMTSLVGMALLPISSMFDQGLLENANQLTPTGFLLIHNCVRSFCMLACIYSFLTATLGGGSPLAGFMSTLSPYFFPLFRRLYPGVPYPGEFFADCTADSLRLLAGGNASIHSDKQEILAMMEQLVFEKKDREAAREAAHEAEKEGYRATIAKLRQKVRQQDEGALQRSVRDINNVLGAVDLNASPATATSAHVATPAAAKVMDPGAACASRMTTTFRPSS